VGAEVSDEAVGAETGPQGNGVAIDPTAVALALGGASRDKADSFLENQNALIAAQLHHLHEQDKHLHLDMWEKRLGVWLRAATFVFGMTIATGFSYMVWNAAHSNSLVVEAFSVPPDMASRGVTGQALAGRLLDQLAGMESQTLSSRAPRSYANSWSQNELKVDIPETGISLQQLDRFLRDQLGHDIHITGEIMRTPAGLSVSARAGGAGAEIIEGAESDLNALMLKASESVYRLTQPYRYGIYLAEHGRASEAMALYRSMAQTGPRDERTWAYFGWGNLERENAGIETVLKLSRQAVAAGPDKFTPSLLLLTAEIERSLPEDALREGARMLLMFSGGKSGFIRDELVEGAKAQTSAYMSSLVGDFRAAAQSRALAINSGWISIAAGMPADMALDLAGAHEVSAAKAILSDPGLGNRVTVGYAALRNFHAHLVMLSQGEDWSAVTNTRSLDPLLAKYPGLSTYAITMVAPLVAKAHAELGHAAQAEHIIEGTPADCYDCLIARAQIAAAQGQVTRADAWFSHAAATAPSVPFAECAWGLALLKRGATDAAIEKFKLASQKGPHFADPLEGWGEALMAKNQSHLALAKFEEADKYAPNWGRLHLKWGEALFWAGKRDEAKAQLARAAQLDLTPSEKAELAHDFIHA
jgi:tetratricopeptide (TPR) repeat protein